MKNYSLNNNPVEIIIISNECIYWWENYRKINIEEKGNSRAFDKFEFVCYSYNAMQNRIQLNLLQFSTDFRLYKFEKFSCLEISRLILLQIILFHKITIIIHTNQNDKPYFPLVMQASLHKFLLILYFRLKIICETMTIYGQS